MPTSNVPFRRGRRAILPVAALLLGLVPQAARATDACITYQGGHVYYVAYQNLPSGQEYIVDLGSKDLFLNATDRITFPDVMASDFSTFFSGTTPNLWVALFGVRNPTTRDGILSANGPISDSQLNSSSMIGAANQIDSWATGLPSFASAIGDPCHLNAGNFPGRVFGSYQDTLNGFSQGSLSGNLIWNVETRLSTTTGDRIVTGKIRFYEAINNPTTQTKSRRQIGYFNLFTDGSIEYLPDFDGDLLPDVPIGSDPDADKCPGLNNPDNTDADNDNFAAPCDCDDNDPARNPGATEACNGIDDNCNDLIDDGAIPVVTIEADHPTAKEPGATKNDGGRFTITRDGCTDVPVQVDFSIGGTATFGKDYHRV